MLENLIKKYKENDVNEVVYRLSYAGKFVIVKGKTLTGSLIIISDTFKQYKPGIERFKYHIYRHLYDYLLSTPSGRFRVKELSKISDKVDYYQLLKKEQKELDKNRFNPNNLTNSIEAYIPKFNKKTQSFGWLPTTAVLSFKRWLNSKERQAYLSKYTGKQHQEPAKSGN